MQVAVAASILLIIILIYVYHNSKFKPVSVDGETYYVLPQYTGAAEAAKRLSKVNENIIAFLRYLKDKYSVNASGGFQDSSDSGLSGTSSRARDIVNRVLDNYNPEVIYENQPTGENGTSYTLDKGEKLVMCLRSKATKQLHDTHVLTFVALHELAHMGNKTWGHGQDYWEVFKFILKEAKQAGIHTPRDYRSLPIVYCGLTIDYNPYYDQQLADV